MRGGAPWSAHHTRGWALGGPFFASALGLFPCREEEPTVSPRRFDEPGEPARGGCSRSPRLETSRLRTAAANTTKWKAAAISGIHTRWEVNGTFAGVYSGLFGLATPLLVVAHMAQVGIT